VRGAWRQALAANAVRGLIGKPTPISGTFLMTMPMMSRMVTIGSINLGSSSPRRYALTRFETGHIRSR
jgi:hypothetical protein